MMAVGIVGKRCPSLELTSAFARHLLALAESAVAPQRWRQTARDA